MVFSVSLNCQEMFHREKERENKLKKIKSRVGVSGLGGVPVGYTNTTLLIYTPISHLVSITHLVSLFLSPNLEIMIAFSDQNPDDPNHDSPCSCHLHCFTPDHSSIHRLFSALLTSKSTKPTYPLLTPSLQNFTISTIVRVYHLGAVGINWLLAFDFRKLFQMVFG